MNELYPVYIILFSNNTSFAKMIRKMTKQNYSHATISTDTTLNNMYSFSDIPFNHNRFTGAGFVRESIWSPMYSTNRYFTVLVTFTDKKGIDTINNKIESFKRDYLKQKYNDFGLIKYYLNFKDTKDRDEHKKQKWFCSEFVTYMLKSGKIEGFEDILQSPQDLKTTRPNVISLGDFTIREFKESDLIRKTERAKIQFIKNRTLNIISECYDLCTESTNQIVVEDVFAKLKNKRDLAERNITKYTALLDWKLLYDKFHEIFRYSNDMLRFPMIELIIRKYFLPAHVEAQNVTNKLIDEMKNIKSYIKGRAINFIDVENSEIFIYVNNSIKSMKYPESFRNK